MRLRVIASVLAGCSALWLNIPAFAYGSFAFPGHGNKPDWIRACKCADQGVALAAQKKYKEALEFYDKANAIYPTAMTYYDRANTLFALKRLKESIESHKRAIEIAPEFWQPYCNIGDIYRINGDYRNAEAADKRAMELAPSEPMPVINLAEVCIETKRQSEARRLLELVKNFRKANTSEFRNLIGTDLAKTGAK